MESGTLSEVGKIAITVSVLGGGLLIAALISIAFWYCRTTRKRKKYIDYNKSIPIRSLSEIETELRELNDHSQPDLDAEFQPPDVAKEVVSTSQVPATVSTPPTADSAEGSVRSSSSSSALVVIREKTTDKSKVKRKQLMDTHIGSSTAQAAANGAATLPDTRISTISSDVHSVGNYDGMYGEVLWPDVIDPYNRGQELELRIAGKAVDVFNCRSITTVTQFRK